MVHIYVIKICKLHFKTNQAMITGIVNSLKFGYSVIQIRNTMHYGIDSSNLSIRFARLQRGK